MKKILILPMLLMLFSFNAYAEGENYSLEINSAPPIEENNFDNAVTIIMNGVVVNSTEEVHEDKYVLQPVEVKASVDSNSNVITTLQKGNKIDVVDSSSNFYKITLNNFDENGNVEQLYGYVDSSFIGNKEDLRHIFSDVLDNMTAEEYDEFLKMLYLECCNEPFEGKVACVEETCRRVVSGAWPNGIHSVIFQKGQFSTARNIHRVVEGQPYRPYGDACVDLNPLREAIEYVRLNGYTVLPAKAAEYGYTITPARDYVFWATYKANGTNFIKIGHHYFGMGRV